MTGTPRLPPGGLAALQPRLTVVRKLSHAAMAGAGAGNLRVFAVLPDGLGGWLAGTLHHSEVKCCNTPLTCTAPFARPAAALEGTSAPVAQSLGVSVGGTSVGSAPGGPRHPADGDLPSGAEGRGSLRALWVAAQGVGSQG